MTSSFRHLVEHLLGLPADFLNQQGEWSVQYNPAWPGQSFIGAPTWNIALIIVAVLLVVYVYTREARSRGLRITLGVIRMILFGIVLFLLNKPTVQLMQSRSEPSVLAVLIDDSSSMRVPDAGSATEPQSRLSAAQKVFSDSQLLQSLAHKHDLRFYRFDRAATPLAEVQTPTNLKSNADLTAAAKAIADLKPEGESTQVLPSILETLQDLQGQRVAGVVVLTDGRDTPARNIADGLDQLKNYGTKIYPVAIGSDQQPRNIEVQSMQVDDVAFAGDVVNVKTIIRGSGYEPGHTVHVQLKDKKTGAILPDVDGKPSEKNITLPDDKPVEVELQWKTSEIGTRDVVVEAVKQPGELDEADNTRSTQVSVLDAKISVLFVDGYPRWDYRYLKTALIRDKSISVSCLLASADFNFLQEGNKPLPSSGKNVAGHFPDTMDQLMGPEGYDVIILGDVDPRYFSDAQLQLINEFVNKGGGLEVVAGPRYSPQAFRNTPIEALLPIVLSHVETTDTSIPISQGFRPVPTKAGEATSIFRFFADSGKNADFLKHDLPEVFWYCRGVTAKPSVGEVLAEHPTDIGPDGHKAPILVAGRFGGRTLFSAIDDSWRWRFYTDESVFDTYWVQQLRYLARNRKIGQRRLTLTSDEPIYELGQQVRLTLRVIDPGLVRQLPDQIRVEEKDANGQPVRMETLVRQEGSGGETFAGSFTADKVGKFSINLPPIATGVDMMETPIDVILPRLELTDPRVDRISLSRLASETLSKPIDLSNAAADLEAIPSAARETPNPSSQPLWNAPITLVVFVLLVTCEWVVRKLNGMV